MWILINMEQMAEKKRKILLEILKIGEKTNLPTLEDELEKSGVNTSSTHIKNSVIEFEEKDLVETMDIEYPTKVYRRVEPKYNSGIFKTLGKIFLNSPEKVDFLESNYTQQMLTKDFLTTQAQELRRKIKSFEFIQEFFKKFEAFLDIFLDFLTTNPEVFKKSPIGLYYLLNPEELEREISPLEKWYTESEEKVESFGDLFVRQIITKEGMEKFIGLLEMINSQTSVLIEKYEELKPRLEEIDESDLK